MLVKEVIKELNNILVKHSDVFSKEDVDALENAVRFMSNKPFKYLSTSGEYVEATFVTKEDISNILEQNKYKRSDHNISKVLEYLDFEYLGEDQVERAYDYLYDALYDAEREEILEK